MRTVAALSFSSMLCNNFNPKKFSRSGNLIDLVNISDGGRCKEHKFSEIVIAS